VSRFLLLVGSGLLLSACGGVDPIDQTLDQTLWNLTSIEGADIDVLPAASIGFGEGEMGGTTGCNTIGGAFRVVPNSDTISIGPLRSSLAACPSQGLAGRERAMMASLQSAARYEVTTQGLELKDATGQVLSMYEAVEPELAGTTWDVIGYNTGTQAVRSVVNGTTLTLEFDEAGKAGGSSGCNTYDGPYTTSGDYSVVGGQPVTIGPIASTKMACVEPDGVMEQESQFLAALTSSGLWRLVGANLELRGVDGALQVSAAPSG